MNSKVSVVYSAIYSGAYPFDALAEKSIMVHYPDELTDENSFLVIWGGEDISPSLYGQKASKFCGAEDTPSQRDNLEVALYKAAIEKNIPVVGICRGAQLACALEGGTLYQHVTNHGRSHPMETIHGEVMLTSSMHHQMMRPVGDFVLLAWPYPIPKRSELYIGENDAFLDAPDKEPEIVLYPTKRVLAIQGHPEFMQPETMFVKHCLKLVQELL